MRAAMIKAFGEPTEVLELVDAPERGHRPPASAVIAGALSAHGTFVIYAYIGGGLVSIDPFG